MCLSFGHLSYVERSPRFTRAALCNNMLRRGTKKCQQQQKQQEKIVNNLYIWPAAPPQPQNTTLGHNFPEMNVFRKPSLAQQQIRIKTSKHQLLLLPGVHNQVTSVFPPFVFVFLSDLLVKPWIDQNLRKNICWILLTLFQYLDKGSRQKKQRIFYGQADRKVGGGQPPLAWP